MALDRLSDSEQSSDRVLIITIPRAAVPQGRPRTGRGRDGFLRVYDPEKSRAWKKLVAGYYLEAVGKKRRPYFPEGPVHFSVITKAPLPKSEHRKRSCPGARYDDRQLGDLSNMLKALEDAGNGILWKDDCQIASITASKWVCAQGQEPSTVVLVRAINTSFVL